MILSASSVFGSRKRSRNRNLSWSRRDNSSVSPQSVQQGSTLTLRVENLAFGGKGVARVDGYTVFVERGLPGQLVEARVFRRKKGFAEARVLRVLEPGAHDVLARCSHFGVCGGCALQNLDYLAQLEAKRDHVKDCL